MSEISWSCTWLVGRKLCCVYVSQKNQPVVLLPTHLSRAAHMVATLARSATARRDHVLPAHTTSDRIHNHIDKHALSLSLSTLTARNTGCPDGAHLTQYAHPL